MKNHRLRFNNKSLFVKLLLGFSLVILISFAFHAISYSYFQHKMRDQLIQSNTQRLNTLVSTYEKQLGQLEDVLTRFVFDGKVKSLKREDFRNEFPYISSLADEFNAIIANYNLDIENMFVYFKDQQFVIDRNGFKSAQEMFGLYYKSDQYPDVFWSEQFGRDYHFRVFPVAAFQQKRYDVGVQNEGRYFPIVVKNQIGRPFYIAAFVKADSMFAALNQSMNDAFYLLDESNQLVYSSGTSNDKPVFAEAGSSYALLGGNYYFYQLGATSKLTYVSVVSNGQIAAQMARMNMLMLLMLALSVALSVAIAVMLSVRFKNPIQRILEGLRQMNPTIHHGSSIQEFNAISDGLRRIIDSLNRKNTLLQKYGYLDKVKSIQASDKEVQGLIDIEQPFHLALFHIHQNQGLESAGQPVPKASFFLEFINLNMTEAFAGSITMQIEKDRILSIVFSDGDISGRIREKLDYMKKVFDLDQDFYRLAISFHSRLWEPFELTQAYEAANDMLRKRKLLAETQIIDEPGTAAPIAVWTPDLERGFTAGLVAGNEEQLVGTLDALFDKLAKEDAALWHYRQFAGDLVSKLFMALMEHKIDIGPLYTDGSLFHALDSFYTVDDYAAFLMELTTKAASMMREKREARDPIVDFVVRFIEKHYGEDIYHELIADRLHISTSYLRNYFKEKTGRTLSDYLFEYRIEKAKSLLVETEELIQDIALKVGYPNANSFTRMFRRLTGLTPGEYRRDRHVAN
ncbi:helix-turn-helix transcriptional regulator [Paenibacillus cymbidii]|uniref:helix-turn-helix transcriptional regulator n=1 Tax=Paenibacillus cymbidii TaxID=1639034 RepID=UPI001081FD97|nr:AraC family transcriptional regulator [Paenibacillus cymbidii]